ncbi:MAG: SatD family protein [Sediminicola sp.]
MVAIITGDIINSNRYGASDWMRPLKEYLSTLGSTPTDWEIYRGDEFQLRVMPEQALAVGIRIKALIKQLKGLDVRMAIGMGEELYTAEGISESNGTAYQFSGRTFETLKELKINLAITTSNTHYNVTMNLLLKLALDFMDNWSQVSAETVAMAMDRPDDSQQGMAATLGIKQSAVSQRLKRARVDLVLELLSYYKGTLKELKP